MSDISVPSWVTTLLPPALTGLAGYFTARLHTKSAEKTSAHEREAEITAAVQADLSQRYKTLFDGYQSQIEGLTREIEQMRNRYERRVQEMEAEIEQLRQRIDASEARWKSLGAT